ncbi:MAG TPA: DUF4355 domain-containing protein [Nonomuraea sp.]|nr:DUF4355 domain-containing protein [Nonomuraea sp.]
MSEAPAEATTETATAEETTETSPKAEVDWKAKSREWEKRAKANADAAAKLAALEESQKSEAQKLQEAKDAAERRASEAEKANLRYRVAVTKQLPAELVDRLRGDTEEEMSADADALLSLVVQPAGPPPFNGGPRTPTGGGNDMNSFIRKAAGHG